MYNQHELIVEDPPMHWLLAKRHIINIILLLIGVGIIVYYIRCADACTYLQGSLFRIELQYLGIVYVAVLILFNILKRDLIILMLLSAGIGVEVFLIGYQVVHDMYCLYCLAFAATIALLFLLNMDLSHKLIVLVFIALGFLVFFVFFEGSVFPVYGGATIPTALVASEVGIVQTI